MLVCDKFSDQVIKSVCDARISFFCAITVSVQVRLNCPEILQCFLSGSFLYGNDYRKGLQRFSAAVLLVLLLLFFKMWHSSNCSWEQLRIVSLNCL